MGWQAWLATGSGEQCAGLTEVSERMQSEMSNCDEAAVMLPAVVIGRLVVIGANYSYCSY
jgi:hypothetical protein